MGWLSYKVPLLTIVLQSSSLLPPPFSLLPPLSSLLSPLSPLSPLSSLLLFYSLQLGRHNPFPSTWFIGGRWKKFESNDDPSQPLSLSLCRYREREGVREGERAERRREEREARREREERERREEERGDTLILCKETRLMLASFPSSPDLIDVSEENEWYVREERGERGREGREGREGRA